MVNKLDAFLVLTDHFEGETITVEVEHCLNARFRQAACTQCQDFCPGEDAITLKNDRPILNAEACLHCGLCLHRCPTGVFNAPDHLSAKLIKTVSALPPSPVDLICPLHAHSETGPAPQAVQTQRCLAALSPATLLSMVATGRELWLDDEFCAECSVGKVHTALTETVAEVNAWGSLIDDTIPILLHGQLADLQPIKRPVYQADQPTLSRRGFFSALKHLGQEGANAVAAEALSQSAKPDQFISVSERLPQFPPRLRMQILAIVDNVQSSDHEIDIPQSEANRQSTPNLPIIDISIKPDGCSACGLCARFCPTGALAFVQDGDQFSLAFQPRLCLGQACDICRLACPEEAVSTFPASSAADLLKKRSQFLLKGDLTTCQKCGQPIAIRPEHPTLCFACRPKGNQLDLFQGFS